MSLSGKTEKRTTNFKNKVKAVLKTLGVPTTAYCATEKDMFRKPRSGMWKEMVDDYDIDIHGINTEDSFLVGDAAGRKGDHSAVDRQDCSYCLRHAKILLTASTDTLPITPESNSTHPKSTSWDSRHSRLSMGSNRGSIWMNW